MFPFTKKTPTREELQKLLRRIVDQSTPNLSVYAGGIRDTKRYNRVMPVLLVPFVEGVPVLNQAAYSITKDLSEDGTGLLLSRPWESPELVIGFWFATKYHPPWTTEPFFALGSVRMNVEIGGGFWQLGVHFDDVYADRDYLPFLKPLADRLIPDSLRQDAPEYAGAEEAS